MHSTVRKTNTRLLIEGADMLGVHLSSAQVSALEAFLTHLGTWNKRLNLTSIRDPSLMIRHHLIDSLSVVPFLRRGGHLMDVGSGAGLPGIPIKILHPTKKVTLLEPRRKRANFLRHLVRLLGLSDIQILETRLESLTPRMLYPLEETIARAFANNDLFLWASGTLLVPGGVCSLMQGPTGLAFLESNRVKLESFQLKELPPRSFTLPFGDEKRTLLFFEKL